MNTHLSEDELILHYYGETARADESRVESHLASCADCQFANQQLRRVMTLVDTAAPVEAPLGFERTAWARLEPMLDANTRSAARASSRSRSGPSPAASPPWCWSHSWPGGSPVASRPA